MMSNSDSNDSELTSPRRLMREDLRERKSHREGFMEKDRTPIVLILDGVDGNYNKGALFRLADAFLIEKMHLCHTTLEHWHRRFLKSARGTFKWVPYGADENTMEVISAYRERGYRIVAAEQCEGSVSLEKANLQMPICIVMGGELRGVSPEVVAAVDEVVELPCLGMANSLNVSMSAGMLVLSAFRGATPEQSAGVHRLKAAPSKI